MGLLDGLLGGSMEDPRTMATLQLAQGLLGGQGGGMQRLAGGMQGYGGVMAQARQQEEEKRRRMLQEQMLMQQLEAAKAQQAERAAAQATQQKDDGLTRRLLGMPIESQMPQGMQGPGAPMQNRGIDPRTFINQGGSMGGLGQAMQLSQALAPPPRKLTAYKPGDQVRDETGAVAFSVPDKPESKPEALRAFAAVYGENSPEYMAAARQYAQKLSTHQPGTTVSVNTGQKGLDNTLKLRGDFRSEPIYKAHQDVQSAHAQITAALKQASPAGDLAGATKLMKILDPGSVVRESELGMAMAASGLVDRMQNYASLVMSGQKLTPTQRTDFMTLANSLRVESEKQYNAKRNEYQGIANRNGLNVDDVLGPASAAPSGGWSMKKVE